MSVFRSEDCFLEQVTLPRSGRWYYKIMQCVLSTPGIRYRRQWGNELEVGLEQNVLTDGGRWKYKIFQALAQQ